MSPRSGRASHFCPTRAAPPGPQIHGRLEQLAKCAHMPRAVSLTPQRQPHNIRRPGGRPGLTFQFLLRRLGGTRRHCERP
jgi:hypothetical protein